MLSYVYIDLHVRNYYCKYECMYLCMNLFVYIRYMHTDKCICMYVCMYAYLHAFVYVYAYACIVCVHMLALYPYLQVHLLWAINFLYIAFLVPYAKG